MINVIELVDMGGEQDPFALIEIDGVMHWEWDHKRTPVLEAQYARPYQNDCRPFTLPSSRWQPTGQCS